MASAQLDQTLDTRLDPPASGAADALLSQLAENEITKLLVEDSNGGVTPTQPGPLPEIPPQKVETLALQSVDTTQALLDHVRQVVDTTPKTAANDVAKELEVDAANEVAFEDASDIVDPVDQEISDAQVAHAAQTIAELSQAIEPTQAVAPHLRANAHAHPGVVTPSGISPSGITRCVMTLLTILSYPAIQSPWLRRFIVAAALLTLCNAMALFGYVLFVKH